MSLEDRLGASAKPTSRHRVNEAPVRLRVALRQVLVDENGMVNAHKVLCDKLGISDEGVFSYDWAEPRVRSNIEELNWVQVLELFEELAPRGSGRAQYHGQVNRALADSEMAYELVDGKIRRFDQVADELGIRDDAASVVGIMEGRFTPAAAQYRRALKALTGQPTDFLAAIRESTNALEAVGRIIAQNPNFSWAPRSTWYLELRRRPIIKRWRLL